MSDIHENTCDSKFEFLQKVTEFLYELTEANRKLLNGLKAYQDLLIEGDNADLERATPRLDRLTGEIRCLDEERRAFVDAYFLNCGWDGPRNFSAIREKIRQSGVTDEEAAAFERASRARAMLIEALSEVDAQNSLNITLIGQGLSFAEVSLRALLGCNEKQVGYGPDDETGEGPSFLDATA